MSVRDGRSLGVPRTIFAGLTLVAVGVQLVAAAHEPGFDPTHFFGYFTILSNSLAALTLLAAARPARFPGIDIVRGSATLAMALVGIVFSILLANLESDVIPWVNAVVHYAMPAYVVLDWILAPPPGGVRLGDALRWLVFPSLYVAYTLVRGAIVRWYPYPFLDAGTLGYAHVAAYVAGIFAVALVMAAILAAIANARGARARGATGAAP